MDDQDIKPDLLSRIIAETIGPLTLEMLSSLPEPSTNPNHVKKPLRPLTTLNNENLDTKDTKQSNGKRKTMSDEERQKLDSVFPRYELVKILRKHSRKGDPEDFKTSIWDIKYRPIGRKYCGTHLVATAGGHIVNILDLKIGSVVSRYEDTNCLETFNCLAWKEFVVNTINKFTRDLSIICVGGTDKKDKSVANIVFINGDDMKDYIKIGSHSQSVNTLEYHPTKKNLLFSGSYDRKVMIWSLNWNKMTHISKISALQVNKLLDIDCNNRILSLIIAQRLGYVVVGGEDGIVLFKDCESHPKEVAKVFKVQLPDKVKLVDGLVMIGSDSNLIGFRYKQWILIADLESMVRQLTKTDLNGVVPLVLVNRLQYCPLKCDYFYMTIKARLLCCGDAGGRVLIYYLKDSILKSYDKENPIEPIRVLAKPNLKGLALGNDTKSKLFINMSAISPNHEYVVAGTNANLICIWRRVSPTVTEQESQKSSQQPNKKVKTSVKP